MIDPSQLINYNYQIWLVGILKVLKKVYKKLHNVEITKLLEGSMYLEKEQLLKKQLLDYHLISALEFKQPFI